jgi:hypothetical protein
MVGTQYRNDAVPEEKRWRFTPWLLQHADNDVTARSRVQQESSTGARDTNTAVRPEDLYVRKMPPCRRYAGYIRLPISRNSK